MIRTYHPDDLVALLRIWTDASKVGHPFLSDAFLASERDNIAYQYIPNSETWVCEQEGHLVGFISLIGNEIGGLFVDPRLHGQGIGRALVDHACTLRVNLEVEVFKKNIVGRAFYKAYGFVENHEGVHQATGLDVLRLRLPGRP